MALTIHREKQPDKLIRMGHAPLELDSPLCSVTELPDIKIDLTVPNKVPVAVMPTDETARLAPSDPPPEPEKNKRGRPKKMADKGKDLGDKEGEKNA